jgi:hypothetical protein
MEPFGLPDLPTVTLSELRPQLVDYLVVLSVENRHCWITIEPASRPGVTPPWLLLVFHTTESAQLLAGLTGIGPGGESSLGDAVGNLLLRLDWTYQDDPESWLRTSGIPGNGDLTAFGAALLATLEDVLGVGEADDLCVRCPLSSSSTELGEAAPSTYDEASVMSLPAAATIAAAPDAVCAIRTARDAEEAARQKMLQLGYPDARLTASGPDGGVDVLASGAVAQVKAQVTPVGPAVVQAIYGIACSMNSTALCFALGGYTDNAVRFAEGAGVALFTFDLSGRAVEANSAAVALRSQELRQRRQRSGSGIRPLWSADLRDQILAVSMTSWGVACLCERSMVGLNNRGETLFAVELPILDDTLLSGTSPSERFTTTDNSAFAILWHQRYNNQTGNELVRCSKDGRVEYQDFGVQALPFEIDSASKLLIQFGQPLSAGMTIYYLMDSGQPLAVPWPLRSWALSHRPLANNQMLEVDRVQEEALFVRVRQPVQQLARSHLWKPNEYTWLQKDYWTCRLAHYGVAILGPLLVNGMVVVGVTNYGDELEPTYVYGITVRDGKAVWMSRRLTGGLDLIRLGRDEVLLVLSRFSLRMSADTGSVVEELHYRAERGPGNVVVDDERIIMYYPNDSVVTIRELVGAGRYATRSVDLGIPPTAMDGRNGFLAAATGSSVAVYPRKKAHS